MRGNSVDWLAWPPQLRGPAGLGGASGRRPKRDFAGLDGGRGIIAVAEGVRGLMPPDGVSPLECPGHAEPGRTPPPDDDRAALAAEAARRPAEPRVLGVH